MMAPNGSFQKIQSHDREKIKEQISFFFVEFVFVSLTLLAIL